MCDSFREVRHRGRLLTYRGHNFTEVMNSVDTPKLNSEIVKKECLVIFLLILMRFVNYKLATSGAVLHKAAKDFKEEESASTLN